MSFSQKLIEWYTEFGRELPWRQTDNPYIIWLSEIILQQTRVEQGTPYFYAFSEQYPNVTKFADADEEEVLRLWQGLGYYSRARNMHKAAKKVLEDFNGNFPTDYLKLLTLPGVGEYTAAAISSFSSNEKRAVLDGNVFRVLSRYFGIEEPINSTKGKKIFQELANELISERQPGLYNQAIMDYGAMICKPKAALCEVCVFSQECVARKNDLVDSLPVKNKGKKSRNRYFHYFVIEDEGQILVSKRGAGDVWENLYEFPMLETNTEIALEELMKLDEFAQYFEGALIEPLGGMTKHILSHQNIYAQFYRLSGANIPKRKKDNWNYCMSENLDKLAKHKLIFSFINKFMIN